MHATPVVTPQSAVSQNTTAGSSATVAISATGTVTPTYQWYSNTSASNTGGTAITGASTASYAAPTTNAGNYYFYCIVTNGCDASKKATSPVFTVVAEVNPATLPVGAGTFAGKTCFDIAESNDNTTCGTLASRQSTKADFNLAGVNTQTYTFTPSGAVSKVRFKYVESLSGAIIKTLTNNGDENANNVSAAVTATVVYQSSLSSNGGTQGTALGKNTANAFSVDIYVVYNNKADGSGADVQIKLKAQVKDCMCCGAMISPTVWKAFMCHNLGANEALDPFTPNPGLVGNFYASPQVISSWYIGGPKAPGDPCPSGYRLPSKPEWQGVAANNTLTLKGSSSIGYGGIQVGPSLMLPNGGASGIPSFQLGYYSSFINNIFYTMGWNTSIQDSVYTASYQAKIRCISEN